jgi:hypothetical protein
MKPRFIMFRRENGVYYSEDTVTRKQHSLRTKDESEAQTLLHAKNESFRQPVLNRQIARTYLTATDPETAKRTWQTPMSSRSNKGPGNAPMMEIWSFGPLNFVLKSASKPIRKPAPVVPTQSNRTFRSS